MRRPRRLKQRAWELVTSALLAAFGLPRWVRLENQERMQAAAAKVGVDPHYKDCDELDLARYKFEEDQDGTAYCAAQLVKYGFSRARLREFAGRCAALAASARETTPQDPR